VTSPTPPHLKMTNVEKIDVSSHGKHATQLVSCLDGGGDTLVATPDNGPTFGTAAVKISWVGTVANGSGRYENGGTRRLIEFVIFGGADLCKPEND
jgi:hypothetical protein